MYELFVHHRAVNRLDVDAKAYMNDDVGWCYYFSQQDFYSGRGKISMSI